MILNKTNDEQTILYLLTCVSTLIIHFFFIAIISILDYYVMKIYNLIFLNDTSVILFMLLIAYLNYHFFIKHKNFLNFKFQKDKKGGYLITICLLVIVFIVIYFGNKNREKIITEKERMEQSELNNIIN